jgi:hypothetical protein
VSAPKSTSVPAGTRVAANGSSDFALLHEQRRPLVDDAESSNTRCRRTAGCARLVALLEVGDVLLAHERHVRRRVDERRRLEHAAFDERRPQLTALLELLVDRDRLGGVDGAVLGSGM